MADIKIKRKSDVKIKKFDKAKICSQKLKNNIVDVKEKNNHAGNKDESSPTEYGTNQITDKTRRIAEKSAEKFNKYGQKSVKETKNNITQSTKMIKQKVQNNKFTNK